MHTTCVFWILRCQSVGSEISGDKSSSRIFWRNEIPRQNDRNQLTENARFGAPSKSYEPSPFHPWVRSAAGVVVYRSVLQCVAVCCSVLQCVAVCCSVLQCVAVCCSVLQAALHISSSDRAIATWGASDLPLVLQCNAVCCNVVWCVAVC